jgi:zinc D-Ala-D-Ala carboxypeptidase
MSPRLIAVILAIALVASLTYNGVLMRHVSEKTGALSSTTATADSLSEETSRLTEALTVASSTIADLTFERDELVERYETLEEKYEEESGRNKDFEKQIRDIGKTVGVLDKLSKTDEELLQKYSKVYFLNENYIPSSLQTIPEKFMLAGRQEQQFHADALPFLENMLNDAARDGIDLKVLSAYRSFDTQAGLKGAYTQTYGSGANTFSADQGYSEHQLGTTLDLTDETTDGPYTSFKNTEAYTWLLNNAYKHGFVLSYPEDNTYYIFEPWHWRFVGEDLAEYLHENDLHFYDLDQRMIDTYLVKIFD